MGSLFQGDPQKATSYTTSSSETPKWMQDAIYNQIQVAQNIANTPFQAYDMPRVAELSPLQQQAYRQVQANQGFYQGDLDKAQSGMYDFSSKGTADQLGQQQAPYLRQDLVGSNLDAGQQLFGRAGQMDIVGAAQPLLNRAASMDIVGAAQPLLNRAASQDIVGAAQPYMQQAGQTTAQSLAERALTAANPYLQASAQSAASKVGEYMSPYQQGVLDVIARQGARNLQENILPGVSDAFIKAGQFGSSRMGEFGSRAVRDTQKAILDAQAQAAQQGYGQALQASQADLARQAQLAGTVGSISGADLSRILQGGSQYGNLAQTAGQLTGQQAQVLANLGQTTGQLTGQQMQQLANLGQTAGQLTSQQMQNLASLGQAQTQAGQAQQQFGLQAAQAEQQARAADYQRQMSALSQFAAMQQQEQAMRAADVAALETAGQSQQAQQQRQLDAAYQQFQEQQLYPKQQMDWLSTQIRGMAPITPQTVTQSGQTTGATYSASPLSQLAAGVYAYKGLDSLAGSDIRIKENVVRVGTMDNGLGVYEYEYKPEFKNHPLCGHGRFRGVMAHEVAKIKPQAVVPMGNGYNAVDYAALAQ